MFKGVQAYFMQQLHPDGGLPMTSAHLLYLATHPVLGADLGWVGDLSVETLRCGVYQSDRDSLDVGLNHAADDEDALARFLRWVPSDINRVWIDGQLMKSTRSRGVGALEAFHKR